MHSNYIRRKIRLFNKKIFVTVLYILKLLFNECRNHAFQPNPNPRFSYKINYKKALKFTHTYTQQLCQIINILLCEINCIFEDFCYIQLLFFCSLNSIFVTFRRFKKRNKIERNINISSTQI